MGHLDRLEIQGRRDKELRPRQHAHAACLRIEHRPRTEQHPVAEVVGQFLEHAHRARHCHGYFRQTDSAFVDGLDGLDRALGRRRANNRDQADFPDGG